MRCGLVLIVDAPNRGNTAYGAGTRVNATAYRIRNRIRESAETQQGSKYLRLFVSGAINEAPSSLAVKMAISLADEILDDINNDDTLSARKKYDILSKWIEEQGRFVRNNSSLSDKMKEVEKYLF